MENLQALIKIDEMATQILDITSQTNLLSLNASIEAARAGEAGRGFAVVAGEIGTLAESSSKTVNEIKEAIASIEESSSMFCGSVESISKQVDVVNAASNDNEAGVEDIIDKNNTMTTTADSIISTANKNQSNADTLQGIINRFK